MDTPARLMECVFRTFEESCLKDISADTQAFMVREYLSIPATFTAFGGLPIGREWRFFADQQGILCSHFYWPSDAFDRQPGLPASWRTDLASTSSRLSQYDQASLSEMAARAACTIGYGAWSVDFALDANGKWWLIDMATAERSWHPKCRVHT